MMQTRLEAFTWPSQTMLLTTSIAKLAVMVPPTRSFVACWRIGLVQTGAWLDKKKLRERTRQKDETYASMGQDILRLARRVYKGAPDLADREGKDYFLRALPSQLRVAVAAANPLTVNECIDHVNRLCVVVDPEDEGIAPKRAGGLTISPLNKPSD